VSEEIDLLKVNNKTIMAPAGYGKTHLIAQAIKNNESGKPILVLTHTNSGVASLREKLNKLDVPKINYKLFTIDGWGICLSKLFSARTGINQNVIKILTPSNDYTLIREAVCKFLKDGYINDILSASYSRLIVDEYQDCLISQHTIVYYASKALNTCVLGDPLQAIFGFKGNKLADWNDRVLKDFPLHGELTIPWRWNNADSKSLSVWLKNARDSLLNKKSIDLRDVPKEAVKWIQLNGTNTDFNKQVEACNIKALTKNDRILIIGSSIDAKSRHQFAARAANGIESIEAVDLRELIEFAQGFKLENNDALANLIKFAENLMTNTGLVGMLEKVESLTNDSTSNVTSAAASFIEKPSYLNVRNLLVEINKQAGVHTYRPTIFKVCIEALNICINSEKVSFLDTAVSIREKNRVLGRILPKRAIGSTLLLKGLEAEVSVILNADDFKTREDLYVAITRGSKLLIICSREPILNLCHIF
jgi:DNA helicase-2/ATP-dependent DNA helicase PcrA